MRSAERVACSCYVAVALLLVASGALYLFTARFMPYHAEAAGAAWDELGPGLQGLILGYLKLGGAGFLAAGVAVAVLALLPLRRGEPWARWATPSVALVYLLSSLYATLTVIAKTGASPPVGFLYAGIGLVAVGALLSFASSRCD